jgi:acyl carrier protein
MTDRQEFYRVFSEFLIKLPSGHELPSPDPETHLWMAGYLDSLAMLEVVSFLEDLAGREIELRGDFLPNFFTMRSIYDSYVAGSLSGLGGL